MLKSALRAKMTLPVVAVVLCAPLVVSCQSDSPQAPAVQRQPVASVVGPQPVANAPVTLRRSTGAFPTFDGPLRAAGEQMSDEEAKQMDVSLSSLAAARSRGTISAAEYNRRVKELRDIGAAQQP